MREREKRTRKVSSSIPAHFAENSSPHIHASHRLPREKGFKQRESPSSPFLLHPLPPLFFLGEGREGGEGREEEGRKRETRGGEVRGGRREDKEGRRRGEGREEEGRKRERRGEALGSSPCLLRLQSPIL